MGYVKLCDVLVYDHTEDDEKKLWNRAMDRTSNEYRLSLIIDVKRWVK